MTHVSRLPVHKDVYFEILDDLYRVLAEIGQPSEMKRFLGEFFTKTERIMLAKRLALAGMIVQKYDIDVIKRVLHVSTETIYRMKSKLESGGDGFKVGIRRVMRKEALDKFIDSLFQKKHSSGFHPLADS